MWNREDPVFVFWERIGILELKDLDQQSVLLKSLRSPLFPNRGGEKHFKFLYGDTTLHQILGLLEILL